MGLASRIGIGAALGLVTGIVAGESCSVLEPLGKAYVMLLESVVYPYVISSLLHGLGRLSPAMALRLLKKSWPFYLIAWVGTLGVIYLLGLAFPSSPPPIMVDAGQAAQGNADFLKLLLPGNVFVDLDQNYVPAVVLLTVLFGVAIQGIKGKEPVLEILALVRAACVKIWNWVVLLAPIAVFGMFAVTAGTTKLSQAGGMAVYLALFLIICAILGFVVIPALVSSLIPVEHMRMIRALRDGLTLSLVTTLSVVALPFIQQAAEDLARENGIEDKEAGGIIETCLAVNYPFGQLGNIFVYFFILFVAFYTRTPLGPGEQAALPLMSLFSSFGSPSSTVNAVDFLSSWLALPPGAPDMYVETMMITRYGQVALSVMGFAFLTYLMTFNYYGKLRPRLGRLLVPGGLAAAAVLLMVWGSHVLLCDVLNEPQKTYLAFSLSEEDTRGVQAVYHPSREEFLRDNPDAALRPGETVLQRIQRRGTLRVGYGVEIVPFSYTNQKGELVGYDIACAYDLARTFNVKLEFVPVVFDMVKHDVERGYMDIWLGGIYVTERRMVYGLFSDPYYQSPIALIVPAGKVGEYRSLDAVKKKPGFKLAVMATPSLRGLADTLFPGVERVSVKNYEELTIVKGWDAALWTLEQAAVWASGHPGYSAVRPGDMGAVMVFAYLMHREARQTRQFVDNWMALRRADGFLERQRRFWLDGAISGVAAVSPAP